MEERILVTGGSGDLGKAIVARLKYQGVEVYAPTHKEMNIVNHDVITELVDAVLPHCIIHTAAIIDARSCDRDWTVAQNVNVHGTYNMCNAAKDCGAHFIHISSTCVFDGEGAPFNEFHRPSPKNWYALTKFAAEQVVQCVMKDESSLIVRTNFVAKKPWKYPKAFIDRFGTYLFAEDVAWGIYKHRSMGGIIHICGKDRISMYDLAKMVSPEIEPMTLAEYRGPPLSRDMSLVSARVPALKLGGTVW